MAQEPMKDAVAAFTTQAPAPLDEKSPELKAAVEAIRGGVRRWTEGLYIEGPQLPIVRNGEVLRHFGSEAHDPVEQVLQGYQLPSHREKASEATRVEALASSLRHCARALANLEDEDLREIHRHMKRGRTIEQRVAFALRAEKALSASTTLLLEAAESRLKRLSLEMDSEPRKRGPRKNVATYSVAAELARLYAKITGKRPTYSEDMNGLSGNYTPTLRDVYDALGWKKTVLRGPAEEAVRKITDADLHPEELRWPKPLVLGAATGLSSS